MNYTFQPVKRKGRNKCVGSWTETGWREIPLAFNSESLMTVLSWGTDDQHSEFTHQDIAHWCDRFHMAYVTGNWARDEESTIEPFVDVAHDVSTQWELYLENTYKLEQFQSLKFSDVKLPVKWFQDWLRKLKAATSVR